MPLERLIRRKPSTSNVVRWSSIASRPSPTVRMAYSAQGAMRTRFGHQSLNERPTLPGLKRIDRS